MADRPHVSPLLSPDDLFIHLKNSLGISLQSVEELLRPRPEGMRAIYLELLGISYGKDPMKMFDKSSLYAISNVSYPELVESNVPLPGLFIQLKELMTRLGYDNLQLRDLLTPEFKRTRVILSEIVNFLKFRTDEEIVMGEDGRAVNATAFAEEHNRVREELEKVQQDVTNYAQKQRDLEPVIVPKQARIEQLTEEKANIEEYRRELEGETKRLESELLNTEEATKRTSQHSQILSEKLISLEQQVTSSPGRVTTALSEVQDLLERERQASLSQQEKGALLLSKFQAIQKAQNRVREALLLLEPYHLSLSEKQRLKGATLEKHALLLELEKNIKRLELSTNNLTRELRKHEEQQARSQSSSAAKLVSLEKMKEERVAERQRMQRTQTDREERVHQALTRVHELEFFRTQKDSLFTARLLETVEMHQRLLAALEKYCAEATLRFQQSQRQMKLLSDCYKA